MHHLSKTALQQLDRQGVLFCTQCRRPFGPDDIYVYIHVRLCHPCWKELAMAYEDNWPDPKDIPSARTRFQLNRRTGEYVA